MRAIVVVLIAVIWAGLAHADKVLYITAAGDTTVVLILDQPQVHALEHDLVSISDWLKGALAGKVAKCRTRMIQEWIPKLQADPKVTQIPVKEDSLVEFICRRADYKNRVEKDSLATP